MAAERTRFRKHLGRDGSNPAILLRNGDQGGSWDAIEYRRVENPHLSQPGDSHFQDFPLIVSSYRLCWPREINPLGAVPVSFLERYQREATSLTNWKIARALSLLSPFARF